MPLWRLLGSIPYHLFLREPYFSYLAQPCWCGDSASHNKIVTARVLVVEDDDFTRLSIAAALRAEGCDVFETALASEAALHAEKTMPTMAVLDLHLGPGPNGIDLARALRRNDPSIGIVILTSYDDPRMLSASVGEPPAGTQYVTQRSVTHIDDLARALRDSLRSHVVKPVRSEPPKLASLTDTQHEILRLIADGLTNQQIATVRSSSVKSVEAAIGRLAKALNITTSAEYNQRVLLAKAYYQSGGHGG